MTSVRRLLASRIVIAFASAIVGAAAVAAIWALTGADTDRPSHDGEVRLSLAPAPNARVGVIEREGALAAVIASVNREINIPVDLNVRVVGRSEAERAGVTGPTYVPKDRTVYFPWSFVEQSLDQLQTLPRFRHLSRAERAQVLTEAMTFVLYHELAHGLIDVLDVPVVASQEAVADDFAAVFAIAAGRGGAFIPLRVVDLDEADAKSEGIPTLERYADDHGFSRQRAIDTLCLVYGSAPQRFAGLVKPNQLAKSRARMCPFTYRNDLRSWRRLLARSLTHEGALRPLSN